MNLTKRVERSEIKSAKRKTDIFLSFFSVHFKLSSSEQKLFTFQKRVMFDANPGTHILGPDPFSACFCVYLNFNLVQSYRIGLTSWLFTVVYV